MGNDLRALRLALNIPAKDMVAEVQRLYPKFDKTVLSKCEHAEAYGVVIQPDALDALYARFGQGDKTATKPRKSDKHRLTHSVKARLPDDLYALLQRQMEADGYATAQELVGDLVLKYVKEGRNRPHGPI